MTSKEPLQGRALPLGDDVSTDILHPPEYFSLDPEKVRLGLLAKYDPTVVSWIRNGDIIVAGRNFGCGSSREAVVRCLALNGIHAIVARSFARIFFRTCMNLGILCLTFREGTTIPEMSRGEPLEIDLDSWRLQRADGSSHELEPLAPFLTMLRERGGILGLLQ